MGTLGKSIGGREVVPAPCPELVETQDYLCEAFPVLRAEG